MIIQIKAKLINLSLKLNQPLKVLFRKKYRPILFKDTELNTLCR